MRRHTLLIDVAAAAVLAILVIAISPGLAVVGLLALLVLIICGVTLAFDRRRRRRAENPVAELRRSRTADSRTARSRARSTPPPRRARRR